MCEHFCLESFSNMQAGWCAKSSIIPISLKSCHLARSSSKRLRHCLLKWCKNDPQQEQCQTVQVVLPWHCLVIALCSFSGCHVDKTRCREHICSATTNKLRRLPGSKYDESPNCWWINNGQHSKSCKKHRGSWSLVTALRCRQSFWCSGPARSRWSCIWNCSPPFAVHHLWCPQCGWFLLDRWSVWAHRRTHISGSLEQDIGWPTWMAT